MREGLVCCHFKERKKVAVDELPLCGEAPKRSAHWEVGENTWRATIEILTGFVPLDTFDEEEAEGSC